MYWQPPQAFDDFETVRFLGAGGMGVVFLARDAALGRLTAIKFVSQGARDPAASRRFVLEARAIARFHHPNVVGVYRTGAVEGRPYLAYEYVEGHRLDRIARPMPWQRVLAIGLGLARGLAAAHRCGVLHRDIKPANIMISEAGEVKLLDFGMAKLADASASGALADEDVADLESSVTGPDTPAVSPAVVDAATIVSRISNSRAERDDRLTRAGTVVGTPLYIAPELWREDPASERSDLYALGAVLYELLVGRLPLAHLSGDELALAAIETDFPSLVEAQPAVPRALTVLIDRCVRRDPRDRPRSAADVRDALEALSALYRPFVGDTEDDARDVALLTESFVRVQGQDERFATRFYERWFAVDPGVRALFRADLVQQQRMLTAALKLAIDNLRDPERLVPLLEDLGRRHARYGAEPHHFSTIGHVLIASLAELDPEWSPPVERAWSAAVARIVQVVQRSMEAELTSQSRPAAAVARARLDLPLAQPRTRWAQRDGGTIAYQVFGNGPIDILIVGEWVTHLEHMWRHAAPAGFLRRLAGFARVIAFDRRGCGLSERVAIPSLDAAMEDVLAVLDAASSDHPVLLGIGDGALVATAFAAIHPGRARALALVGGGVRMSQETGDDRLARAHELLRARWGGPLFVEDLAPSLADDPTYRRWWAGALRNGAGPAMARRLLDLGAALDVGAVAPAVHAPTRLIHRVGDTICPIAQARRLAAAIPGASLVELPGADHVPWSGDVEAVVAPIQDLLADPPPGRALSVVASTAVAVDPRGPNSAALGDTARRMFARYQGIVLPAGDGAALVAAFDMPGRAVTCARGLATALRAQGLSTAVGVETGLLGEGLELSEPAIARAVALAGAAASGEVAIGPATRGLLGAGSGPEQTVSLR